MLLTDARRPARTTGSGELIRLADQDRSRWDRALIAEGQDLVRRCLRRDHPGPYQIQAAIQAVHSDAATVADTDWRQIVQLYDQLLAVTPSPVVALNRAVAVAEIDGPQVALALTDRLALEGFYLFHAIRADLLRRLGRDAEAARAYRAAIERTGNAGVMPYSDGREPSQSPAPAGQHAAPAARWPAARSSRRRSGRGRGEPGTAAGPGTDRDRARRGLGGPAHARRGHREDLPLPGL
jgi:RNA polymerase sigma-70 factor (ECF subfamily)